MGVVLYILLSGKVPFPGESNKEIIENVLKGEYHFNYEPFKALSEDAKDLIKNLLVKDVSKRYDAVQAFNHPWIQDIQYQLDTEIAGEAMENMKNFMDAVSLKKATLTYLAAKLPEKNIEDLRQMFIKIDENGDGRITGEEFNHALTKIGMEFTGQEIQDFLLTLDLNHNGSVDYTEFIAGCMRSKIYLKEEYLRPAFEYFDRVIGIA